MLFWGMLYVKSFYMVNILSYISEEHDLYREKIRNEIKIVLSESINKDLPILFDAMNYVMLPGGSFWRSWLFIKLVAFFQDNVLHADVYKVCCAIEMLHTYSLVHDDLPAMDNDDYRRGKESCHKKYGEAIGILVGDALLTLSFDILSSYLTKCDQKIIVGMISIFAKYAGCNGMIAGQVMDINVFNQRFDITEVRRKKTGALFVAVCEASGLYCGVNPSMIKNLRDFGAVFGEAFQVYDDIKDGDRDDIQYLEKLFLQLYEDSIENACGEAIKNVVHYCFSE